MKILDSMTLRQIGCVSEGVLGPFGDVNVLIGPNNCGKTTILKSIHRLASARFEAAYRLPDDKDNRMLDTWRSAWANQLPLSGVELPFAAAERHMRTGIPAAVYRFNVERVLGILAKVSGLDTAEFVTRHMTAQRGGSERAMIYTEEVKQQVKDLKAATSLFELSMASTGGEAMRADRFSLLWFQGVAEALLRPVLLCEDTRLKDYKNVPIADYIESKDFPTKDHSLLWSLLARLVDRRISDYLPTTKRIRMQDKFDAAFAELGSGARSLICLLADLVAAPAEGMVLIDEPELGLNPAAKQALVSFMLEQTQAKQFFLSTHDPSFTNPALWKLASPSVDFAIFLYSELDGKFVKANKTESQDTAGSFAGYLPHTTSPRDFHLYVEGRWDAQTFRCLLDKCLWHRNCWRQVEDRTEVFHLGGTFWQHLLATVPTAPYRRLIVLDGDKQKDLDARDARRPGSKTLVERIAERYDNRFFFVCGSNCWKDDVITESGKGRFGKMYDLLRAPGQATVVYTLARAKLDDYFPGAPSGKQNIPSKAQQLAPEDVPAELQLILRLIPLSLGEEPWDALARELGLPTVGEGKSSPPPA